MTRITWGRRRRLGRGSAVVPVVCLLAGLTVGEETVEKQVVIFPFTSNPARLGAKFPETLQMKIKRNGPPWVFVDQMEVRDLMESEDRLTPKTPVREVARLLRERFGDIHGGIYGAVAKRGDSYRAQICFLDLSHSGAELRLRESFSASGERGMGTLAEQAAKAILGRDLKKPVEAGRVPEPAKLGPMVSKNPGFEKGEEHPTGWERTDGLTTHWVKGNSPLGKKGMKRMRLFTLMPQTQADAWWKKWRGGAKAKNAPKPLPATPPCYDTVAGLHGAHYFSDYIPIKPGMRYRISADMKGPSAGIFFPKIFVKDYAEVAPTDREKESQRQEVWRTYLACRNPENKWLHYSEVFTPKSPKLPDAKLRVKWMRIVIYAYWPPPGEFFFDNVKITEEPGK